MTGSKDLEPSTTPFFPNVFFHNQFCAEPQWPAPGTTLSGMTAIITGGNTGLGYEAAVQLLDLQLSHLVLAVRSEQKGEEAAAKLRRQQPDALIEVWHLDMCSYESIQTFVKRVESKLGRVDLVLLNAGLTKLSFNVVEGTGHEEIFQVNYLSTVLLATLLLPLLKAKKLAGGPPARLTIASAALSLAAAFPNRSCDPLFPSFDDPKTFDKKEHYNTSKLLAHIFLWKLVDHVSADNVIVNLADPAWCRGTRLTREVTGPMRVAVKVFELTGRTPRVGASCFVDALVSKGKESHGCFIMSWKTHPYAHWSPCTWPFAEARHD